MLLSLVVIFTQSIQLSKIVCDSFLLLLRALRRAKDQRHAHFQAGPQAQGSVSTQKRRLNLEQVFSIAAAIFGLCFLERWWS
jgi:hypothetical protein